MYWNFFSFFLNSYCTTVFGFLCLSGEYEEVINISLPSYFVFLCLVYILIITDSSSLLHLYSILFHTIKCLVKSTLQDMRKYVKHPILFSLNYLLSAFPLLVTFPKRNHTVNIIFLSFFLVIYPILSWFRYLDILPSIRVFV